MSDIRMPTARNRNPDGSYDLVQLPGTDYLPKHTYYDKRYHKDLRCLHCEAKVHFNKGAAARAGSARGAGMHFQTNRGQTHENCQWPPRAPETESRNDVDPERGYRINLNTRSYTHLFNRHSGAYGLDERGRLFIRDPSLRRREPYAADSAEAILTLMKRGERDRLADTKVVFGNRTYGWTQFCVLLGKPGRYDALVRDLRINQVTGVEQPALMEIDVEKPHEGDLFENSATVRARRIAIGDEEAEHREYAVPGVVLRHNGNGMLRSAFHRAGRYLVLGVPRLNTRKLDFVTYHYLNITVNDLRQVHFGGIEEIAAVAKARAARRETKAEPVPELT